jgi:DNA-3-methyladenine glycosylase
MSKCGEVGEKVGADFFKGCVDDVARRMVGCFLLTGSKPNCVGGQIIEVESYCQSDPAAHCHPNASAQRLNASAAMKMPGGHVYLYRARLMTLKYWCINLTSGTCNHGSAVLIRALRPSHGTKIMEERRNVKTTSLCNGPAKLWFALGALDSKYNGSSLAECGFGLFHPAQKIENDRISCAQRVGITQPVAKTYHRSYALKDCIDMLSPLGKRNHRNTYTTHVPIDKTCPDCGARSTSFKH